VRVALGIEYDGSRYCGWERQRHCLAVQEVLEQAVAAVAAAPIATVCAGRTDAGVHAAWQVVHFDTGAERPDHAWVLGTNANLPGDVSVRWSHRVDRRFHARFSAEWRRYRYYVLSRPTRPALLRGRVTWERRPLDVERMRAAATALVGEHDFSAYRAVACQARTPVRTVHELAIREWRGLLVIDVRANAFLHHMVRNIAGVILEIGTGRRDPGWAAEVLATRDRAAGGVTAPPDGLYLVDVGYPPGLGLPAPRGEETEVFPRDALW